MGWLDEGTRGVGGALGGKDSDSATLVGGLFDALGKGGGGSDGLSGLLQAFRSGGLGTVVDSWVSTGANIPVSSGQLTQVLGSPMLEQLAQKMGLSPDALSAHLSQILPGVVDKLTPDGKLPESGLLAQALGMLRGKASQ